MVFSFGDFVFESNLPLTAVSRATGGKVETVFELLEPSPIDTTLADQGAGVHHWRLPDGKIYLSYAKATHGYILQFVDHARFVISHDGASVQCIPGVSTDHNTVEHLLLDQVLPRVLSHRGSIVLHAGAVRSPKGALVFLGDAGAGKSTLVASFGNAGHPILADDAVMMIDRGESIGVLPGYTGLRLRPDSLKEIFEKPVATTGMAHYSTKRRLLIDNGSVNHRGPNPCKAIFLLQPSNALHGRVKLNPLSERETFMAFFKNAFRLDLDDSARCTEEFSSLGRLAKKCEVFALEYPRQYSSLHDVIEAVLDI